LITASGAGLAAATLAILFWFAGPAAAQGSGPGSGEESTTSSTTATTVFGAAADTLANTGAEMWLLVTGAGVATAGAVAARRLLRNQT
jgi:hypothetical protein